MLDFDQVQTALGQLGANTAPAESLGTLCGLIINNMSLKGSLAHTLDEMPDPANVLANEQMQVLEELFAQTRDQLNNDDLSFEAQTSDPYFGGNGRINMQAALCPDFCCDMKNWKKTWDFGDMIPVNGCKEYVTCNEANMGMQTTPLPCPEGLLFQRARWGETWGGYCNWPNLVTCEETCMPGGGQD